MSYDDLMERCQAVATANGGVFEPPVFDHLGGAEWTMAEPGSFVTVIVLPDGREWGGSGARAEAAMSDLLSRHE